MSALKTLVLIDDLSEVGKVSALLEEESMIEYLGSALAVNAGPEIALKQPDIIWIELGESPVLGLSQLASLKEKLPGLNIFVSYKELEPNIVSTAFRLGAVQFLEPKTWKEMLPVYLENLNKGSWWNNAKNRRPTIVTDEPIRTMVVSNESKSENEDTISFLSEQKDLKVLGRLPINNIVEELSRRKIELIWLQLGSTKEEGLNALTKIKEAFPQLHVFVCDQEENGETVCSAFQSGASDFLFKSKRKTDIGASLQTIRPKSKKANALWEFLFQFNMKTRRFRLFFVLAILATVYLLTR